MRFHNSVLFCWEHRVAVVVNEVRTESAKQVNSIEMFVAFAFVPNWVVFNGTRCNVSVSLDYHSTGSVNCIVEKTPMQLWNIRINWCTFGKWSQKLRMLVINIHRVTALKLQLSDGYGLPFAIIEFAYNWTTARQKSKTVIIKNVFVLRLCDFANQILY